MKTYLARQPIFDQKNEVVAYELLFRQGSDNNAEVVDDYIATLKVIKDLIINFGLAEITNNKRAFIKFNNQLIKDGLPELFRPEKLVIELSDIDFQDTKLITKLEEYHAQGYLLALDRFNESMIKSDILNFVDIVKLDFCLLTKKELEALSSKFKKMNKVVMAQKVEDHETFSYGKDLGCAFFQGYFFQKPKMFESNEAGTIPTVYFELLKELSNEDVDYDVLANIIKQDASMTYAILKLMNTVMYHSSTKITTVKQALIRIGVDESRKVILINMLNAIITDETSNELIHISLLRAKMAEKMAPYFGLRKRVDELFILGLLSLMNIIMGKQMQDIIWDMPLEEDVIMALLGTENTLSSVMELLILNELEKIQDIDRILGRINCTHETFNTVYMEALVWADKILLNEVSD